MNQKHHIVLITGAGISQESGLGVFRGQNGLWNDHKIEDVASLEGFEKNPEMVLDFYNDRRRQLLEAKPNLAHQLLAKLEDRYKVSIITQNIDDLHERAGSSKVVHLHGELLKVRSCSNPDLKYSWTKDLKLTDTNENNERLRPDVVWFGEPINHMDEATKLVKSADLLIVVGTTLQVYPAANLLLEAPFDVETVYIDPEPVIEEGINLTVIKEKASDGLDFLINNYLPY